MDKLPENAPMENPLPPPLAGLNPADLLAQGAAEDTIGNPYPFQPPSLEEMAALFPQFEILELIGKGGMGVVYKVRQKELDRIVALKILPPAIGETPGFAARFTREAQALAKLNHPGIVTLHEFGQQDGLYFILMEFVDGVNLAQLMHTGRISPREALAIVPQICDALQFAHDQGIVHRDIKPENILLDRLGRVKVADFGIAKLTGDVTQTFLSDLDSSSAPLLTEAGKIIGTPAYMAPEQIDHPSEVDHRADIYALGVVFYQMLTGELPGKELQAPSRKVHIDVRLDEIVLKAMEKNPELRYQQASMMKTQVGEIGIEPTVSPAVPLKSSTPKTHSTGRMIAIGCGVLGMFALVLLGGLSLFWYYSSVSRVSVKSGHNAQQKPKTVKDELQFGPVIEITLERSGPLGGYDLDTGEFRAYTPAPPATGPEGTPRWRQETGMDLMVDRESYRPGILFTGTLMTEVDEGIWDDSDMLHFAKSLPTDPASGRFDDRMLALEAPSGTGNRVTRLFRTQSGGGGILQILSATDTMGVKIRYKLVQAFKEAAHAAAPVLIVLHPDREPFLMGEQVSEESLQTKLLNLKQQNPDLTVVLNADERVSYVRITEMLESFAKLGITKVTFATTARKEGPPNEPPKLRRLDWQDQVEACAGDAWLPSGEIEASNDWMPPINGVNIDKTSAARENPRFLCLWISHPQFDAMSLIELKLLDSEEKEPLKTPTGNFAFRSIPASPENADMGWITATLCAGKKGAIPPRAAVVLRYSAGAWQFWNDIAPDFHGTQALANGVMMNGPGQDADGHAFIQITRDSSQDTGVEQFDFVAITKDGRRLERTGYGTSSSGKVTIERFPFDTPLAQVKSFECRKRPVHQITWPVVLKESSNTYGKMKIDFDRAGDSMQNILANFRRKYGVRIAFEDLDFDAKKDAITLGRRISTLEEKQRDGKLTARETELLINARRMRTEEKLRDETLIDVGARYEGVIKADSLADFLNQLTKDTPYDWSMIDSRGTWVVWPRAGTRLKYPVYLDTDGLTVEEAVKQVIAQRPAGSEISMGEVVTRPFAPGTDSTPWLHVKCKGGKIRGKAAWWVLSMIGEGARPDSVWELAGYKEHRMFSITPGTSNEHAVVAEAQAWLLTVDHGGYPKSHEMASAFFQNAVTAQKWDEALTLFRKPLGEVKSRRLLTAELAKSLPGAPDGAYFVMQFDTTFAAKEKAVETVTFMSEKDGTWKAAGYFIK